MIEYEESIFDEKNVKNYKLWQNIDKDFNEKKEIVLNIGYFNKISKKEKILKTRIFVLTPNYLFYKKDQNKIRGILKTEGVRVKYISVNDSKDEINEKNNIVGIRLMKNMKYSDLWCPQSEFEKWKPFLEKVFIQTNFHEKYNPMKMIGKGSFARVYLIENLNSKEKLAVKAFSKDFIIEQDKGIESLLNEIKIMKNINHDNIIDLIEIHESDNSIYLVLELLEGGELFNYIKKKGGLSSKEYYKIIKNVLKGLCHLKDKKIMHRDLKPENIIFKSEVNDINDINIKLIDFGLATNYNIDEYLFKKCGTPGYIAPEILNFKSKINSKCDIFSLGIIFYLLVVGNSPFYGDNFDEVLEKNKKCEIDFENEKLKKNLKLLDLLKNMLEINPKNRFSAKDCLEHPFFKDQKTMNELSDNFNKEDYEYYINNKNNIKLNQNNDHSIVMRENIINGKINTVEDSFNNNNNNNKNKNTKRESIYNKLNENKDKEKILLDQINKDFNRSENNSDYSVDEN